MSQADAAALYDRVAAVYDGWARLTESRARRRAMELADVRDGQTILEVAVGTGLAFADVVRLNPSGRNVGIDLSAGMLDKAVQRLRKAGLSAFELSVGTAFDIHEREGSFDTLLNSYMFDLLDEGDWEHVVREFLRVLRPGGKLILVNMTLGERLGSGIYDRLYTRVPRLMGGCRGVRLTKPLQDSGFSVHQREYVQQWLFPSEVILATK